LAGIGGGRLLTTDPGLLRTYTAGRVTLSVAVALAVAFPLARTLGQPPTVAMLALSVAMVAASAISGRGRREQVAAAGRAVVGAALAVTVGVLLAPLRLASYAAFVAVMAGAAWGSRLGPRYFGVGLLAVMAYFFALFTGGTLAQLPWLLGAVALGVLVALAVRVLLLPDRPRRRLRWLLIALRARCAAIARAAAAGDAAVAPVHAGARGGAPARVDEVVLQLHDLLSDHPELVDGAHRFQRHVFAVVSLTHFLVLQSLSGSDGTSVAHVMPPVDPDQRLAEHLAVLEALAEGRPLPHMEGEDEAARREEELTAQTATMAVPEPPRPAAPDGWLTEPARSALQAAIAGSVAIAAGVYFSPERWYWVALSAFYVLVNTASRGATVRKAVERTVGTAAGVAGGLLVGFLLSGRSTLELVMVFPLLFIGFWMLPVSYAVMIAMFTILLALMYDLLGQLTPALLLLRLLDTAIGAAIGMMVAYFLLPMRTRGTVEEAFASYFAAFDGLLAALATPADQRGSWEAGVLDATRGLDRAVGALYTTVYPAGATAPGRRPSALREQMVLALTARYWIHRAAARLLFHGGGVDPAPLAGCLEALRHRVAGLRDGAPTESLPIEPDEATRPEALALLRADAILRELARARAAA
jgi:uncharacterized membrane protein YccC